MFSGNKLSLDAKMAKKTIFKNFQFSGCSNSFHALIRKLKSLKKRGKRNLNFKFCPCPLSQQ